MPMANFIAARQNEPRGKQRYAKNKLGQGIDVVYNVGGKAGPKGGHSEIQSIRFRKDKFDKAKAKAWLKAHDFKTTTEDVQESTAERLERFVETAGEIVQ
jgi:hypothetical protein